MAGENSFETGALRNGKLRPGSLFKSDFYEVKNWGFDLTTGSVPGTGYNDCLCVMFIRNGNFLFDLASQSYHLHTGHVLLDKPDYEFRLRPSAGQCSIINFSSEFYKQFMEEALVRQSFFFSNADLLTLLLRTSPEMEYLHHRVLYHPGGTLERDQMILELLSLIVNALTTHPAEEAINSSLKRFHLVTIERAKEYINENFSRDISLFEISSAAYVSPFHFSRIFKKFTGFSPHQYLQNIRLKHSEVLLKASNLPIADVSFNAGFTTAEYFATCFRQKFGYSPRDFRRKARGIA